MGESMELVDSLQKTYSQTKFWVIIILVSVVSVLLLPEIWRDLQSSTQPSDTLWKAALLAIALFGVCLLPFAAWHHYQRNKFFTWLRTNGLDSNETVASIAEKTAVYLTSGVSRSSR